MRITTRNFQARPTIDGEALGRLVDIAIESAGKEGGGVSIAFVDDACMIDSHSRFIGGQETADVLAFAADSTGPNGERELGDVVVCTDQAARQAPAQGHGYRQELLVLALHGVLHLLGFDHTKDDGEMRRLERRLRPRVIHGWQELRYEARR